MLRVTPGEKVFPIYAVDTDAEGKMHEFDDKRKPSHFAAGFPRQDSL